MPDNPLMLGRKWEPDGQGHWISSDFRRLAECINDVYPDMYLAWIPPENRQPEDTHCFGIIHERDGREYVIFTMEEKELNNPARVITRISLGDSRKRDVMAEQRAMANAEELLKRKKQMETLEELADFAKTVLNSPLHTFKHNGMRIT